MLIDSILKAIKDLEADENRSKESERVLQDLKGTVKARMKENLMDFLSVGESMGYGEIKKQVSDLLDFIESIEKKNK